MVCNFRLQMCAGLWGFQCAMLTHFAMCLMPQASRMRKKSCPLIQDKPSKTLMYCIVPILLKPAKPSFPEGCLILRGGLIMVRHHAHHAVQRSYGCCTHLNLGHVWLECLCPFTTGDHHNSPQLMFALTRVSLSETPVYVAQVLHSHFLPWRCAEYFPFFPRTFHLRMVTGSYQLIDFVLDRLQA